MKAGLCVLFISGLLIISGLLTGGLPMGAGALTAVAQSAPNSEAPAGDAATVSELVEMLTSPFDAQRKRAIHRVTDLAYRSPEVDLSPTIPALVDIYKNDPNKKYRLAAVSALYAIGDKRGMEQLRQRFPQEPSLVVQYVAVETLLGHYGPRAFAGDVEAATLARNVLARSQEVRRLARRQRLRMWPRVEVGPLEVVQPDSLQ